MKLAKLLLSALAASSLFVSCEENPYGPTEVPKPDKNDKEEPAQTVKGEYAEGADISWVTQMEKDGEKFYTTDGKEMECTALMKEIGFDAIRLRVWVDPEDGWCGKEDVLEKAKRVKDLGMRLMIDFHYSDSWADPSKQNQPAAWSGYNITQMQKAVNQHTKEVLTLLKENDIDVEWVQTGNEVNSGMLWPLGKVKDQTASNFINLVNSGYSAVKEIYPAAKVIIHISNGHDAGLFDWFFGLMASGGAKYDLIGMSLYPDPANTWKSYIDKCVANIKTLNTKYNKPVIICEMGMPVSDPQTGKEAFQYILDQTKPLEYCHGIFCWEPQSDGVWKPESYNALGWRAYDKGAFKNGKPTAALEPFK